MEAIGVLGSVIAIGQALAALPKIVETLRSLADVKAEYANLLNELATLRALYSQTELVTERLFSSHGNALSVPEETSLLLESTRTNLNTLIQDLENLASGYRQQKLRRHIQVANAIRWQWNKKRVTDLGTRANKCRTDLHMAMTMLSMFGQSAQSRLLLEVHSITTTRIPKLEQDIAKVIEVGPNPLLIAQSETEDSSPGNEMSKSESTVTIRELGLTSEGDSVTVKTSVHVPCGFYCACRCHSSRTEFRSPPWLKSVVGSFLLSYSGQPLFRGRDATLTCDQPSCQNSQPPAYLHYHFPRWLCNRAISFTASLSSLSGYGATLHMTLPRMLDRKADIWYHIMRGDNRKTALWIQRHGVLPADRFDTGMTLLSYATHKRYYDALRCLMQTWPRHLVQKSYDKNTFAFAERELSLGRVPDDMQGTVKELLNLWNEDLDLPPYPDFPEVGSGAQKPLLGRLLQRACIQGDVEKVRYLISAGADINFPDFEGKIPLHLALINKNYDCALALMDSDCDISAKEYIYGNVPLAYAFEGQATPKLVEVLSRLVPKTAETYKTMFGCTAMHELSRLRGGNLEDVFQLLADAGQSLEARHEDGETPLLAAVSRNNNAVFKVLVSAGASLNALSATRSSVLHHAAHVADAELLRSLLETEISLDIELRNSAGHTALDTFRYCLLADPDLFPSHWRRPSDQEQQLFEELLRTVRDRYLNKEIAQLECAISLIECSRIEQARQQLATLMMEKVKYHRLDEAETIRIIKDVQICQGMMDAAIEALKEIIEVYKETMRVSLFTRPSVFDQNKRVDGVGLMCRDDVTEVCGVNSTPVTDLDNLQLAPYCPNIDWNFC